MMTLESLTKAASQAVRKINAANDIKLKKHDSMLNGERGAVIYKDTAYSEYRVLFFNDDVHQASADYHTSDLDDALATATNFCYPEPAPAQEEVRALPTRPRGYHAAPSKLLRGLLGRVS